MKKQFLVLSLLFMMFATLFSQGLEDIIVEVVPVSAEAVSADPKLNANYKAYRVFADMAPGYGFQAVWSYENHEMIFETTTKFYNYFDEDEGTGYVNPKDMTWTVARSPQGMFDSYIAVNGIANRK
ncbi:MAG: hypothetical protein HC906_13870, partial [Bacteroidales bacterium]|nr:hypothetical protein [Bacteroidales bacterium]